MPATSITTNAPRVWIGCLNCYNRGFLVGDWFDATYAADVTVTDAHWQWGESQDAFCEELWIFDHDNLPVKGEMSPHEAQPWADAYNELDSDHLWPAYCAWVDSGSYTEDSNGVGSVSDFLEAYQGQWDSFRDFADDFVESTGMLRDATEDLVKYFDYDRFERDLKYDYTVQDAPDSGVYVFRNN